MQADVGYAAGVASIKLDLSHVPQLPSTALSSTHISYENARIACTARPFVVVLTASHPPRADPLAIRALFAQHLLRCPALPPVYRSLDEAHRTK